MVGPVLTRLAAPLTRRMAAIMVMILRLKMTKRQLRECGVTGPYDNQLCPHLRTESANESGWFTMA